jgi:hypothetical protein
MPGLDTSGKWTREPPDGPVGQSKQQHGQGLTHYYGRCPEAKRRGKA